MHRYAVLPEPSLFLRCWEAGTYRNCKLALTMMGGLLQDKLGPAGLVRACLPACLCCLPLLPACLPLLPACLPAFAACLPAFAACTAPHLYHRLKPLACSSLNSASLSASLGGPMREVPLPRLATTYLLKRVRSVSRLLLPPAAAWRWHVSHRGAVAVDNVKHRALAPCAAACAAAFSSKSVSK
jgi:hypothetical protein